MAREHARILCSIWRPGDDFRDRSPEAQRLYFLLLSQRELNNAGVMPLMVNKWSRLSPGTRAADVERALAELVEHGYVVLDEDTEELLIRTFIRNDGVAKQPNVLKSALRLVRQIESPKLRSAVARELVRFGHPGAMETAAEIAPQDFPTFAFNPSTNPLLNPSANPSGTPSSPPEKNPSSDPAGWGGGRGGGKGSRSVGGSGGEPPAQRPPDRCKNHADVADPPPCGRCASARRAAQRWDAEQTEAASAERAAARDLKARCPDCDENGMRDFGSLGLGHCAHPKLTAEVS